MYVGPKCIFRYTLGLPTVACTQQFGIAVRPKGQYYIFYGRTTNQI